MRRREQRTRESKRLKHSGREERTFNCRKTTRERRVGRKIFNGAGAESAGWLFYFIRERVKNPGR